MEAERWQQIDRLLDAALERAPEQRAAFLEQACGGDEALRREVASLLAAHAQATRFIEEPAVKVAAGMLAAGRGASLAGRRLGPYEILGPLGAGGMGEVYLARDARLGRRVALKLLSSSFTQDHARVRRLRQEARATSALNHPNILTIYEIGEQEGTHFIAAEYVEGQTLRQRMTAGRVSVGEALEVATQVAGALGAAHGAGVVHRDIKPENLMLRRDGWVKVLDFGIAKLLEQRGSDTDVATQAPITTEPGVVMGTAHYMAPEQAQGQEVDGRADLWSLGVVLYEMVAGRRPFDGETPSHVVVSVLESEPPRLSLVSAEAPAELDRIVEKALAKERAARYQRAEDFLTDLRALKQEVEDGTGAGRAEQMDPGDTVLNQSSQERAARTTADAGGARTIELEAVVNNLPQPTSSFIGRATEIAEVRRLLATARLVSLAGPGGIGKTRLALEVAREALADFADGVWFVDLAALADAALVPKAIATALGLHEEAGRPLLETIGVWVGGKRVLLLLDNCEHVVEACAALAEALLRACPRLRALATSREALAISGEAVWSVPPLSLPDLDSPRDAERLAESEAVRLFVDRAVLSKPGFVASDRTAGVIAQVCAQLEGIPLAIELAAARVKVLSVEQILEKLSDQFRLLTGGDRTALARQQTLRAAIDWSYELLTEEERVLLARLSVFTGGWTLEAAEAVCAEGGDRRQEDAGKDPRLLPLPSSLLPSEVLDLLAHLAHKSLVLVEEREGQARYRMLETIREYAWEKLVAAGQAPLLVERHADWFLRLAERAGMQMQGPQQAVWLRRLEADHDNLRAVLRRSMRDGTDTDVALRLCAALGLFWVRHGHESEGRGWLEAALARGASAPPGVRAKALEWGGAMAWMQGDHGRSQALLDDALVLQRTLEDKHGLCRTLCRLGYLMVTLADYDRATAVSEESLGLARELGDLKVVAGTEATLGQVAMHRGEFDRAVRQFEKSLAVSREYGSTADVGIMLVNLGEARQYRGELDEARRCFEQALEIARALDDNTLHASSLGNLAHLATARGEYGLALAQHREALVIFRELQEQSNVVSTLERMGCTVAARGDAERALKLVGAAARMRETIGAVRSHAEQGELDRYLDPARAAMDGEAAERAVAEGRALTLEQAVEYALQLANG